MENHRTDNSVRLHYRYLIDMGFIIKQGYDSVTEDDFLAAYRQGQAVDLHRGDRHYWAVHIEGWQEV